MSLDTVVEDIRKEAQARAEEIRESAESRADEIIESAEEDAEDIIESAEDDVQRDIEQLREQRLSSAKLEAKQERLDARRSVLTDVKSAVESALASLPADRRETLTRTLLEDATAEFDTGNDIRVYGRESDEELIQSIIADSDEYVYGGVYDCLGGVVVESEGSRVRVNNTFDSILEDVWEDTLREISDRLFEQ